MRTVSFSSPPIQQVLSDNFICHIVNSEGDPSAGMSQAHAPTDPAGLCSPGIGSQNVQTLFLTPDGDIFHTASGFRGPEALADEIQFAGELFQGIQAAPELARQTIPAMQRQRMLDAGIDDRMLDADPRTEVAQMMNELRASVTGFGHSNGMQGSLLTGMRHGRMPQQMQQLGDSIFAGKTQQARMQDYRFAVHHPMMPLDEFLDNPRSLVGNGVSAFASGSASGGQIGGRARPNGGQSFSQRN